MVVVLPAPLRPRNAHSSPRPTRNDSRSTTVRRPKRIVSPSASIIACHARTTAVTHRRAALPHRVHTFGSECARLRLSASVMAAAIRTPGDADPTSQCTARC